MCRWHEQLMVWVRSGPIVTTTVHCRWQREYRHAVAPKLTLEHPNKVNGREVGSSTVKRHSTAGRSRHRLPDEPPFSLVRPPRGGRVVAGASHHRISRALGPLFEQRVRSIRWHCDVERATAGRIRYPWVHNFTGLPSTMVVEPVYSAFES